MNVQVIFHFAKQLECGACEPVLIEVSDPSKLSINVGVIDPAKIQTFVRGEIESFTLVADATGCNRLYQYTLSYDDAQLVDPLVTLDECDIVKVCCAGCTIEYVDQRFIDQSTVSSLLDNGDGTFTHDDGLGNLTIFDARSPLIDNGDGTFTHTDEAGVVTVFSALGALVDNLDNSFTYTDQIGAPTTVPFGHTFTQPVADLLRLTRPDGTFDDVSITHPVVPGETITTLVDNGNNTFTYTSEDATVTAVDFAHQLSEPVAGTVRLTRPDGTFDDVTPLVGGTVQTALPILGDGSGGLPIDLLLSTDAGNLATLGTDTGLFVSAHTIETITTLVDNANNTFTYTSEDATVTNFNAAHTLSEPVANTVRLTRPDGTFDDVLVSGAAETITTLVDNANNTFTYTSEDATVTNFNAAHTLSEPVANTVRLTRPDGTFDDVLVSGAAETITTLVDNANNTFTYTSEDATVTNFNVAHTLTQPVANTIRLTKPDGSMDDVLIVHPAETITTLVDNGNSFTYTSEDATVTIFDTEHTLSEPFPNIVRLTKPDGTFDDVTITVIETITTLVDNANNTFTYTSENATITIFDAEHDLTSPGVGTVRLTRPDATFNDVAITVNTTLPNFGDGTAGSPINTLISTDVGNQLSLGTDTGLFAPPAVAAPGSNIDWAQNPVLVSTVLAGFTIHTTVPFNVPGPVNTYKFTASYVLDMSALNQEYNARVQIDGVLQDHVVEERIAHLSGTGRYTKQIVFIVSSIAAGARTATFEFASPGGATVDMYRSYLEVERLI
jgi:hypothetical protein